MCSNYTKLIPQVSSSPHAKTSSVPGCFFLLMIYGKSKISGNSGLLAGHATVAFVRARSGSIFTGADAAGTRSSEADQWTSGECHGQSPCAGSMSTGSAKPGHVRPQLLNIFR